MKKILAMTHQQKRIFLLLPAVFLLHIASFAQTMQLADIFKIYKADSSSIKQLCAAKKLYPAPAKKDVAATRYKFEAADSSKTALEMIYPKDTAGNTMQLNYWFSNKKEYNNFKRLFVKNGFSRQKISPDDSKSTFHTYAERYTNKDVQIEFIRSDAKPSYWLFMHHTGSYTW